MCQGQESSRCVSSSARREMRHSGCPSDSLFLHWLFFHTLSDSTISSFHRGTTALNPFISKHIREGPTISHVVLFPTPTLFQKHRRLTTTKRSPTTSLCETFKQTETDPTDYLNASVFGTHSCISLQIVMIL